MELLFFRVPLRIKFIYVPTSSFFPVLNLQKHWGEVAFSRSLALGGPVLSWSSWAFLWNLELSLERVAVHSGP